MGGAVVAVSVGAAVSVCSRGGAECSFGIGGVVLPIVSVTTGAFGVRVTGRGRDGGGAPGYDVVEGRVDAIDPAVSFPSGLGFVGSVKFVVVSTFVFVSGGAVSPGALIVEVTPLAEPSWTVWYSC